MLKIIGESKEASEMRDFAKKAAYSDQILFLRGKTGSGKDHLAEYIHTLGRGGNRFVAVDCGAIPEPLCESILFGHTGGAYTDAKNSAEGLLSVAKDGTLFINEVANMSVTLQARFLRVLDTKTFRPIGSTSEIPINTRIIAATNADVEKAVKEGKLREDLYYRLKALTFTIPTLRERKEDIPLLSKHFLVGLGNNRRFSPDAMEIMEFYSWPGNVRELKFAVERAVFYAGGQEVIEKEHLKSDFQENREEVLVEKNSDDEFSINFADKPSLKWEELENDLMKQYLAYLLKKTGGKQLTASRISGLSRGTIRMRMTQFGIKYNYSRSEQLQPD